MTKRRSAALESAFPGSAANALQDRLRAGDYSSAFAEFASRLSDSPAATFRSLRDLWLEGETGDLSRAPSDSPWTDFLNSSLAWRRGEDLRALELLARASRFEGCAWMRYYLAEILLRRLDLYAAARREIDGVLEAEPWLWEARCLNSEIRMALGLKAPDASSRGVPAASKPAFLAWRGAIKTWSGRPRAALADLDAAAALGNLDARGWRGGALLLLGRGSEALADLTAVLDHDPKDPEALVWRGECHRVSGRLSEASVDLDAALELSESSVWARVNRALLRLKRGDEAGARHDFARLAPARYVDAPDDGSGRDLGRYVFDEPSLPAARLAEVLESALLAARGCRRFDAHLNAAWMRAAGIAVPERPSPQARLLYWLRAAGVPCPPEPSFGYGTVTEAAVARAVSVAPGTAKRRA